MNEIVKRISNQIWFEKNDEERKILEYGLRITLSEFINNLIQTMSVFAIVSDFAQKDRLNTFCRKIENKFKIK